MVRELSSSQLLNYKKLLQTVLNGIDSAISVRSHLIDYDSVSKYEHDKIDSLNDPEPYYHFKMFDVGIGIIRRYYPRDWLIEDNEQRYFHFTIRIYNFSPSDSFNLKIVHFAHYSDYGEWLSIDDSLPFLFRFVVDFFVKKYKLQKSLFYEEDIF